MVRRAPAPPERDAGTGWQLKAHGHVQQINRDRCHDGIGLRTPKGGCTLCAPSLPIIRHPIQCPVATMMRTIEDLAGDWRRLDVRIQALSDEIKSVAITTSHQVSQSLRKLNSLSLIIICYCLAEILDTS